MGSTTCVTSHNFNRNHNTENYRSTKRNYYRYSINKPSLHWHFFQSRVWFFFPRQGQLRYKQRLRYRERRTERNLVHHFRCKCSHSRHHRPLLWGVVCCSTCSKHTEQQVNAGKTFFMLSKDLRSQVHIL